MTRFQLASLTAIAALNAPFASVSAQGNAVLKGLEGRKVRLTAAVLENDERAGAVAMQGTVFEIRGDSIHLIQDGGMATRLPLSNIRTLKVYNGKDHARGAYRGAVVGAVVGLFVTFLSPPDCDDNGYGYDCRADGSKPTFVAYAWETSGAFALLGSMVGAIRGADRWEPVIAPQRVTIAPMRGGVRIGFSF